MNDLVRNGIAVSIVSHGHGAMVEHLIARLLSFPEVRQILLTHNIPEASTLPADDRLEQIDNGTPAGFGENHNRAFRRCRQRYFCLLNPDVELPGNPFPQLLAALEERPAAVVAPLVQNSDGVVEDSIRYFPTLRSLLRKALGISDGRYEVALGDATFAPNWVAGMFMLFRSEDYASLGGFDEGYFLYYEDVDICVRAWQAGREVLACPAAGIVHDARRDSRRKLRYLRWHLASMARYFGKYWGRLPDTGMSRRKSLK